MRLMNLVLTLALISGAVLAQPQGDARSERISIRSEAVDRDVPVIVHLPKSYSEAKEKRYPVIYFLHGAGRGSERTWERRGCPEVLDRLIADKKMPECIIVCPRDAGRMTFYINWKDQATQRHGDFITQELPKAIDAKYRTRKGRAFRALMGDSMGGFGALVNALRNPEAFGSVSAHEPAIYPEDIEQLPSWIRGGRRGRPSILSRLFGDPIDQEYWLAHNVFSIIKNAKKGAFDDLPIYFDVGKGDRYGLDKTCPEWAKLLKKKGVKHTFHLREGGHGRRFFEASVPSSLAFHGKLFNAALKAAQKK